MITYLGAGVVLGLSAGFSPGPLLALVVSQTLRHGVREGVKVAAAPLITDFPIILLSLLLLTRLSDYRVVLGLISIAGGLFVSYLAYDSIRTRGLRIDLKDTEPRSLGRGALVNALSPHPYLFWLTVGAPTVMRARTEGLPAAAAFVAGFLGCLVGSKVFLAMLAGRSKHLLSDRAYGHLMRALGVLLFVFAFVLLRDGWSLLGLPLLPLR